MSAIYIIISVILVSLISFIGLFAISARIKKFEKILLYIVSFAAGALLADVFVHLLPELIEKGFSIKSSFLILAGIGIFFVLEKFIQWQHCHLPHTNSHTHPFAYMALVGDALHNFIDGLIIASSYLISIPAGIATTLAVIFHEIPQEIGDFGILLHGNFSRIRAILLNFLTALTSILGAIIAFLLKNKIQQIELLIIPIAIGGFIYIAGSDLIPELHKHSSKISQSILQLIAIIAGVLSITALLLLE